MKNNHTLTYVDNFNKIKDIKSRLLYGCMIDKPDFTLVIPVYGFGKFLTETLSNIQEQKKSKLRVQIIISDNKEYEDEENPFLTYFKNHPMNNLAYFLSEKTLGQLNNFNRIFSLAETEYVAMLHDDDLLVSNYFCMIEQVLPWLRKHPRVGMIHGNYEFFKNKINLEETNKFGIYKISKNDVSSAGFSMTGIPSCGYLINKKALLDSGGYNDVFFSSGDAFVSAIMMQKNYLIYQFSNKTGYYRIGDNTSLKFSICLGFIKQDYMFYEDWENSGSLLRKIKMHILKNYVYSHNIESKVSTFGKINPQITIQALDFNKSYKKYHKYGLSNILYHFNRYFMRLCHIRRIQF